MSVPTPRSPSGDFPSSEERRQLLNSRPEHYRELVKQHVVNAIIDGRLLFDLSRYTNPRDTTALAVWVLSMALVHDPEDPPSEESEARVQSSLDQCALRDFAAEMEAYVERTVDDTLERIEGYGIKAY